MKLILNGSPTDFEGPMTLLDLLAHHRLKPETVVIEHNFHVPPKPDYAVIEVRDGDKVEIVKFMGGG